MDIHGHNNSGNSRYAALPEYPNDPESQVAGRKPYKRQPSNMADNGTYRGLSNDDKGETEVDSNRSKTHGLGLGNLVGRPAQIKRVPVGIARSTTTEGLLSPASLSPANFARVPSPDNVSIGDAGRKSADFYIPSHQSSSSYLGPSTPWTFGSDMGLLGSPRKVDAACPTQSDILTSPWSWISVPLIILAVYSTAFSGIFLGIALAKPRWGDKVGTNGHLSFANASLLSAIFSKTVEISFVTVFVALLGQVLTRRAFSKANGIGGISIAEMNMRTWIMQPGSLLVSWQTVRYANSFIGAVVLISAFSATWYTTASEALVSPKLKFGPLQERSISGLVTASYANAKYLGDTCEVPVAEANDQFKGSTCLQIRHAGMGFSFLSSFLRDWAESVGAGNTTTARDGFEGRPLPVAVLYDNTTINGQWITPSRENITTDSSSHGRLVENVTMAMPHAGIFKAVRDPANRILQPDDLQGAGEYIVQASLPVPIVNILCVGLSAEEMSPMIVNVTDPDTYVPNATVVDSLFGWDPQAEKPSTPYFPKLPIEYNTVVHIPSVWGPPAISLLATPPKDTTTNEHVVCSIKSALYRNCTTWYKVAESGGLLTVHCDADERNTLPYYRTRPDAPIGEWNSDWKDIGGEWIRSLALNNGVSDANASSARLLTQYIPEYNRNDPTTLSTTKPTIGEAIGVLAGGTLLLSSLDAPYEHTWNYSETILPEPQRQSFPARYSYKDYASGGTQGWQGLFYVVLFTTFLLSATALGYLCWKFTTQGYVTDYTEPQNLFALAVNSPPSSALYGACGGGPKGEAMARKWTVDMMRTDEDQGGFQYQPLSSTGQHPHFFIRCNDEELSPMMKYSPSIPYTKTGKFKKSRPPTMNESWGAGSPVVEQYQRLAG